MNQFKEDALISLDEMHKTAQRHFINWKVQEFVY